MFDMLSGDDVMFSSDSCSRNLCVFVMYDIKRMEGSRITQGRSSTYISLVRAQHTSPISHLQQKADPPPFMTLSDTNPP
jgi:hypothetical protein